MVSSWSSIDVLLATVPSDDLAAANGGISSGAAGGPSAAFGGLGSTLHLETVLHTSSSEASVAIEDTSLCAAVCGAPGGDVLFGCFPFCSHEACAHPAASRDKPDRLNSQEVDE